MMQDISKNVGNTYMIYTSDFTTAVKDLELIDPVNTVPPDATNPVELEL